jgi:hypothetical protein
MAKRAIAIMTAVLVVQAFPPPLAANSSELRRDLAGAQSAKAGRAASAPADQPKTTKADIDGWMASLSNWGRWGANDQIGTLNLITPDKRKQALKLVKEGIAVSLAHTVDKEQAPDSPRPLGQQMTLDAGGHAMDLYTIWYHGSVITHIDSLCHYSFEGKIYNGYDRAKIAQGPGCPSNGIEHHKNGIMTRGILVDLPRMKNVPYLEPGTPCMHQISRRGKNSRASRSAAATPCSCARAAGRGAPKKARGTSRRMRPAITPR